MCTRSSQKRVFNLPPYKFLKDAKDDFDDFISRISDVVVKAALTKKTDATKELFDGFKASFDQVINARAGDYGSYLIRAVEAKGIFEGIDRVAPYSTLLINDRLR
jgi:hypothetical protein